MNSKGWLEFSFVLQVTACLVVLFTMHRRKVAGIFPSLTALLTAVAIWQPIETVCLFHRRLLSLSKIQAWSVFFWGTITFDGVFLLLQVAIIYSVFAEAMRPFEGLQTAGKIVFRWVGVVSALVAFSLIAGPELFAGNGSILMVVSHLHQGIGVLTVCLLVFVCFATRPLGLTFRSHIFGVSLGLGIVSVGNLIEAAWLVTKGAATPYSPVYLFDSLTFCVAICVWGVYFALPEPKRRMILLPTTSPFFFWNRISEILGDAPGNVAVAGFSPDMLAEAEIEMLTAATSAERHEADHFPQLNESQPEGMTLPNPPQFLPSRQPSLAL